MYTIEKCIREFNGQTKEVKLIAGVGNLTDVLNARKVSTKDGKGTTVISGYGQSLATDGFENGEKKGVFFPLEVWGRMAETLGQYGKKGTEIAFVGRLEVRKSKSKEGKEYENETLVLEKFKFTQGSKGAANAEPNTGVAATSDVVIDNFVEADDDQDIPF